MEDFKDSTLQMKQEEANMSSDDAHPTLSVKATLVYPFSVDPKAMNDGNLTLVKIGKNYFIYNNHKFIYDQSKQIYRYYQ